MEVLFVIVPFVVVGLAVMFIAFSGGPGAAREAYLSRGGRGRFFTLSMVVLYLALGVAVPAAVIAAREEAKGGVGSLRGAELTPREEEGKALFIQNCKSCHTLEAVQAHGVTGPNLDELGGLDRERVVKAIDEGGTGSGRMPPDLLKGEDAEAVGAYVASVAGR
jgi:mono/diheme cytochrome c family protein